MSRRLTLINGDIHTMDPHQPRASTVAIEGDRIVEVGSGPDPLPADGDVVDLGGRCVLPGLVDGHIHFTWYALGLREVDVRESASLSEMLEAVARRVEDAPPDTWIVGRGWDQERWPERRFPTAADLDRVAPEHPVVLRAKNGHALVANSEALAKAGVDSETPDPAGGRIGRDDAGNPNGLLFEGSAMSLVTDSIPEPTPEETEEAIRAAFPRAWRVGLTGIHDVDSVRAFSAYQHLHRKGELGLRIAKYLPIDKRGAAVELGVEAGLGDDWLHIAGLKGFVDGALGARTAAMLAPYRGEPDNRGVLTVEPDELRGWLQTANANGLPLALHAIGDRANRLVLDAFAEAGTEGLRHRIEHVQLLDPADVGRLAELGVIASMQPIHATQDYEMAERYWGQRCATAYAWRSLLEVGTILVFGSDCPVEDLNPFLGIHAAVTRRTPSGAPGPEGWIPAQRLTVEEAVWAYTRSAAEAVGLDDRLGAVKVGCLADLIVLDRDIFTCDPMAIADTRVAATMIGGRFFHREID